MYPIRALSGPISRTKGWGNILTPQKKIVIGGGLNNSLKLPADAIDNSSIIISSGTMNAKFPLWTAVVQFLPVKALLVYT